ncbi:MAG: T9SS type A sorting domain-containing protein [Saprospiraceae bacterium]|nr:T9SS type A sorting domain-containing protein [Saprospiraceae bacterium]
MQKTILALLFWGIATLASAQYLETFSTPNKGYLLNQLNDLSGLDWALSPWASQPPAAFGRDIDDYFQTTAAGLLEGIDFDQEVCWESPLINTAAAPTVSLSVELGWEGFDADISGNPCTEASLDYIKVQYSVDGGAYTTLPNIAGGNACATVGYTFGAPGAPFSGNMTAAQAGVSGGSNLRIRVCANMNSNTEIVRIDNVSIPTAGVTLGCTAPTLSATASHITCGGPNSGGIALSVAGGTPGYTYAWSNMATQEDLTDLSAGTYTVTVTDAGGCTATATATVETHPFSVETQSGAATCAGLSDGEIDLNVNGGTPPYTYSWSDLPAAGDPQDRSALLPGTYSVSVSDSGGCTGSASATVAVAPAGPYVETFSIDNKGLLGGSVCSGPSAGTCTNSNLFGVNWNIYGLTPLLGIEPDDYFSTSGGKLEGKDFDQVICWESPVVDIDPPGTGAAFSVDLSWSGFDQEPPGPTPQDLIADHIDVEYSTDGGAWTRLPNQVGGGLTGHSIVYLNGSGSNLTGSQTLSASGISGSSLRIRVCGFLNADAETMSIDNVSVPSSGGLYCPVPELSTASTPATCFGGKDGAVDLTVSGGSPGYTYQWSNGANTEDLSGLGAGQYAVTVTDNLGYTVITVAIVEEATEIVVQADPANSLPILCFGGSDGLLAVLASGGAPGYTFEWSNGQLTESAGNLSSGAYSVTATDSKGCTGSLINILLADPAPVQGFLLYETAVCAGAQTLVAVDTIFGGGGGPYQYSLDGGLSLDPGVVVPVAAGAHGVTFRDRLDCAVTDSFFIEEIVPAPAAIGGPDTVCLGKPEAYVLNDSFTNFQWQVSANGLITQGQGTSTVLVQWTTAGNQVLAVFFNNNGCPDSSSLSVYADVCTGTGAPELRGLLRVQPNPFGEVLSLLLERPARPGARLRLSDTQGRVLWEQEVAPAQLWLDTAAWPAGMYFLQVQEAGQIAMWKLVKG